MGRTLISLFLALLFASAVLALPAQPFHPELRQALERATAEGRATLRDVALGRESLDAIELEPMQVWAKDAKIIAYGPNGEETIIAPPRIRYFRGRVIGEEESAVFVSMTEGGAIHGIVLIGERRWTIGTGVAKNPRIRTDAREQSPVLASEIDAIDEIGDPATEWKCDVDEHMETPRLVPRAASKPAADAGNVSGATYQMRIAVETDDELCAAFGNNTTAISAYIADLIGKASVVYSRDLNTTLVVGETHLRVGGAGTDPWTAVPAGGTGVALAEFGTYWHNNYPMASVPRSSAIFLSGRNFSGGIAWRDKLCDDDLYCGDNGASCGSSTYAGKWAGAYAFNGSTSVISTVTPDPTATVNGVEYGLPNTNFWMLLQVLHELGHNFAAPHSSCVALSLAEQEEYEVDRSYVDLCLSGGTGCYAGSTSAPEEKGTIMSYCHNIIVGGFRASRYLFGKAGEPSEKMLPIFKNGLGGTSGIEGSTPDVTITNEAAPLSCTPGRTASVPTCAGCTYAWQIAGGSITSATNTASITFTPNSPTVTLTVTILAERGCGITASKSIATSCISVLPPTNVTATATSTTTVNVQWTASLDATSYNVYRSTDGTNYALAGNTASTSFNDPGRTADTAYLYKVRAVNGGESGDSAYDLATTTIFTDDPLVVTTTRVKATHIAQLRTAVNAVRALTPLGAVTFTDPTLTIGSTRVKAVHITELRNAIDGAREHLALPALAHETITATVTRAKTSHISGLRNGVR